MTIHYIVLDISIIHYIVSNPLMTFIHLDHYIIWVYNLYIIIIWLNYHENHETTHG